MKGGADDGNIKTWKFPRKFSRSHCIRKTCKQMGFTERSSCRPYKNCFRKTLKTKKTGKHK